MTREEAIENLYALAKNEGEEFVDVLSTETLIDCIYDYFESRICKNCKWYIKNCCENPANFGCNLNNIVETFGCNRFERKKNGNI